MGETLHDGSIGDIFKRQKLKDEKTLNRLIDACSRHPSNRNLELERRKYQILFRCSEIRYETYIMPHRETSPTKKNYPLTLNP